MTAIRNAVYRADVKNPYLFQKFIRQALSEKRTVFFRSPLAMHTDVKALGHEEILSVKGIRFEPSYKPGEVGNVNAIIDAGELIDPELPLYIEEGSLTVSVVLPAA